MNKSQTRHFDLEIDKLANSIENTLSGEVFDTEITRLSKGDLKVIKKRIGNLIGNSSLELLKMRLQIDHG